MIRTVRVPWWLLLVAFVVVPLVEIYAIISVGRAIGAWPTIGLLVIDSIVGAWLVKREGSKAWNALATALGSGRMPSRELADGALILIGGTLMLTPGFVTDLVGILLVLPLTRPLARGILSRAVGRRLTAGIGFQPGGGFGAPGHTQNGPGRNEPRPESDTGGSVVQGEVVGD